jgi:hypothetical protein
MEKTDNGKNKKKITGRAVSGTDLFMTYLPQSRLGSREYRLKTRNVWSGVDGSDNTSYKLTFVALIGKLSLLLNRINFKKYESDV